MTAFKYFSQIVPKLHQNKIVLCINLLYTARNRLQIYAQDNFYGIIYQQLIGWRLYWHENFVSKNLDRNCEPTRNMDLPQPKKKT